MTKKAQAIYNTYCGKLQTELFMYKQGFYDFAKFQDKAFEEYHNFQDMVTQMFHYNLLSEADFDELFSKAYPTQSKIVDSVLRVYTII